MCKSKKSLAILTYYDLFFAPIVYKISAFNQFKWEYTAK